MNTSAMPQRDALVRVQWPRVLFFHYRVPAEVLRPHVPRTLQIELHDNSAWLTLVALTMRNFRPSRPWSIRGWLLRCRGEQRFLNVRTYVRHGGERGAFFLWGWLSRPFHLPLPERPLGLPCGFADITYRHRHEAKELSGTVRGREGGFAYCASLPASGPFSPPPPGSLAEFALEQYTGLYTHCRHPWIFRAWHDPWLSTPVNVTVGDDSLLRPLGCFGEAELAASHYAPGLPEVWLGTARKLETSQSRHGASAFFTMP
jgi:uncharacterized protein